VVTGQPDDSVAVLIPARNEGESAIRVIRSLLDQDHRGPLDIILLLRDCSDSSLPYLEAAFPHAQLDSTTSSLVEVTRHEQRRVLVAFTGDDNKSHKLNWMAQRLEALRQHLLTTRIIGG